MSEKKNSVTIVAVSAHYYGSGSTIKEAKKNLKKAGGSLRNKYILYLLPIGAEFQGIDNMGFMNYKKPEKPVCLANAFRIDE